MILFLVWEIEDHVVVENLTGEHFKAAFAEIYPPPTLFSTKIHSFPVIYPAPRNWLNKHGTDLQPHSSHRIIMTLDTTIYVNSEDKNIVVDIVNEISTINRSRTTEISSWNISTTPASRGGKAPSPNKSQSGSQKVAHKIVMRFRHESETFTGDIGESWNEHVAEYQQVEQDYNLENTQKLHIFKTSLVVTQNDSIWKTSYTMLIHSIKQLN